MRKMQLLTAVAASVLIVTAAGAAENSDQKSKSEMSNPAPAAQQNAPAEKIAPSMQAGPKKPETTGQAPNAAEPKSEMKDEGTDKSGAAKPDESKDGNAATMKENTESKPGTAQKSTERAGGKASTTGQGAAAGAANLSSEQRTKITSIIRQHKVAPAKLDVTVSVGTRIPASVHFYPLPQDVVVIYPEWRGYDYILVGDQIVVVNPRTHEIVAILEA